MKLLAALSALLLIGLRAYVLSWYWSWFVEVLGAPALPYTAALGLVLLYVFFHERLPDKTPEPEKVILDAITYGASALFYVAAGFLVHLAA